MTQQRTRGRRPVVGATAAIVAAVVLGVGLTAADHRTDSGDEVRTTGNRAELLQRAEERLIRQCMSDHGFRYVEQISTSTERVFPYVVDDVAWAREHGYGTMLAGPDARKPDANDVQLDSLSPDRQRAWQRTLLGSGRQLSVDVSDLGRVHAPDNGCTAEARRVLYQDLPGWYRVRRVVDHLGVYVTNAVTSDPRYGAARDAWARCVRQRGYVAASPEELRAIVTQRTRDLPRSRAHEREVAAAIVEAACATSTSFPRTIRGLERKYRPTIEGRFLRERTTLAAFEATAVVRAEQVLADS